MNTTPDPVKAKNVKKALARIKRDLGFTVAHVPHPREPRRWFCVNLPRTEDGKYPRRFFDTLAEVETFCHTRRIEIVNKNPSASVALSDQQRLEAAQAFDLLRPFGMGLLPAVQEFIRVRFPDGGRLTVKDAFDKFIEHKSQPDAGLRPKTLKYYRQSLKPFVDQFGTVDASQVTTENVKGWADGLGVSAVSRATYRRALAALFSFAESRGWCIKSPVAGWTMKAKRPEVEIYTPEQVRLLLQAAHDHPELELAGYLALALFAGIRPEGELDRMKWKAVRFEDGVVRVEAEEAKTHKAREVQITLALKTWLPANIDPAAPIVPPNIRGRRDQLLGFARVPWIQDGLRKSFASYHLARWGDMTATALALGHTSTTMLFQHYRGLTNEKAAREFWSLKPRAKLATGAS